MVRKCLLTISIIAACFISIGQDIHFSMTDLTPLTMNPANTGVMDGDWRFASNYRTQWKAISQPLETVSASFDTQIYRLPKKFSAGLVFVGDRSGGIQLLVSKILLSAGYKFNAGQNLFSVGIQGGYVMKRYSLAGMSLPGQFNMEIGQFDASLPSGEDGLTQQLGYADVNVGALWQRPYAKGDIEMGISAFHVNMPNESFFNRNNRLGIRPLVHAAVQYNLNEKLFVKPGVVTMFHSGAQEILFNAYAGIMPENNTDNIQSIYMGLQMRSGINRNGDAAIIIAGIDFKKFQLGLSYDVNYSGLDIATDNRGAFEISFIYTSPSSKPAQLTLPCDRY